MILELTEADTAVDALTESIRDIECGELGVAMLDEDADVELDTLSVGAAEIRPEFVLFDVILELCVSDTIADELAEPVEVPELRELSEAKAVNDAVVELDMLGDDETEARIELVTFEVLLELCETDIVPDTLAEAVTDAVFGELGVAMPDDDATEDLDALRVTKLLAVAPPDTEGEIDSAADTEADGDVV